jgi:hypothetical protein
MRKRIAIEHLRVGMYLEEFVGSWLDHPFWRARFRVEDSAQLQRLRASGIREVWIDTARGTDVAAANAAPPAPPSPPSAQPDAGITPRPITYAEEMRRAGHLISKAEVAVKAMFADARMGRTIEARDALPLVEARPEAEGAPLPLAQRLRNAGRPLRPGQLNALLERLSEENRIMFQDQIIYKI